MGDSRLRFKLRAMVVVSNVSSPGRTLHVSRTFLTHYTLFLQGQGQGFQLCIMWFDAKFPRETKPYYAQIASTVGSNPKPFFIYTTQKDMWVQGSQPTNQTPIGGNHSRTQTEATSKTDIERPTSRHNFVDLSSRCSWRPEQIAPSTTTVRSSMVIIPIYALLLPNSQKNKKL